MGVIEGRKSRIIQDTTFAGGDERSSVNKETDLSAAVSLELLLVLRGISRPILYSRHHHGVTVSVILCRIRVKPAFRQVPKDPSHATLGCVCDFHVIVESFLLFEWRSSPGFAELVASVLDHAQSHTSFRNAVVCGYGRTAVANVSVNSDLRRDTTPLPSQCERFLGAGDSMGDSIFTHVCVDENVLVEVNFFGDGRKLRPIVEPLVSGHFRLLGSETPPDLPLLEARTIVDGARVGGSSAGRSIQRY